MNTNLFDVNTLGSIASVAGLGATFVQWIRSRRDDARAATISEYLEWLRRQDQLQLVDHLHENQAAIEAISDLLAVVASQADQRDWSF